MWTRTMMIEDSPAVPPLADDVIRVCESLLMHEQHMRALLRMCVSAMQSGLFLYDLDPCELGMLSFAVDAEDATLQEALSDACRKSRLIAQQAKAIKVV